MLKLPRIPLGQTPDSVGLAYENVCFPSRIDGTLLKGWYIPGKRAFTLVIVNGGAQNRVDLETGTLEISQDLVEKGYNTLLFDLRGRGESEGQGYHLVHSERDLGGAVDYLKQRFPSSNIGLMGFSTGAAAAIIFASREKVAAVISDNCFASVTDSLTTKLATDWGVPRLIVRMIAPMLFLTARILHGYKKVDPVGRVADITCPILFIQGDADDLVPISEAYELHKASGNALDDLWIVPNTGHTQAYHTNPALYIERVTGFLEKTEVKSG
ncbi:MAG TPA: alpha/beta fold hydrolase [Dehalococcoidia bacterium]|nr:alpha/beta fold hydrolase [Dehalococcoidia bacterium]